VTFLGHRSTEQVNELMGSLPALRLWRAEDFGIAAVEAMAAGARFIALGTGRTARQRSLPGQRRQQRPGTVVLAKQTRHGLVEALSFFEEGQL